MIKKLKATTKGYINNILRLLNIIEDKERYIEKAPQSIQTNYFFTFLGVILTVVIIVSLIFIKFVTQDENITGLGIVVVAMVCFSINVWKLYRCEEYHNRRPQMLQ